MIDYEKLKIAHELAEKLESKYVFRHEIGGISYVYCILDVSLAQPNWIIFENTSIDVLIAKLTELTHPKTKYKVGDTVLFLSSGGCIGEGKIGGIDRYSDKKYYITLEGWCRESELYPTKHALIEAQIEYWLNQLKDIEGFSELTGEYTLKTMSPTFEGKIKGFSHSKDKLQKFECEHETDGINYLNSTNEKDTDPARNYLDTLHLMCRLCGERYGYSECHHESDGICFTSGNYKCKKCGEFYR